MPTEIRLLAYSAILTWLMVLVASYLKAGGDLQDIDALERGSAE